MREKKPKFEIGQWFNVASPVVGGVLSLSVANGSKKARPWLFAWTALSIGVVTYRAYEGEVRTSLLKQENGINNAPTS